jgi:hypothetical protein
MRKEVLLAILFGFVIGLVITFGVYTANKSLKKTQTTEPFQVEVEEAITPSPTPATITIYEPVNEALIDEEKVTLKGKSFPNAVVAVVAEEEEYLLEANDQGLFQVEISLIGGVNQINITAVSPEEEAAETNLSVVFSTAKIELEEKEEE